MQGGNHKQPLGYTVIETMIFMAISGLMFLISMTFINGKQATVEYKQSLNDINVQMKSIVNEVANGEYESLGSNHCVANDASGPPSFIAGTVNQGMNGGRDQVSGKAGCIFLGKIVQFNVNNNANSYAVYSVAGRQTIPSSSDTVKNFADAQPVVIDSGTINVTQIRQTKNGLAFTGAWECTTDCSGGTQIGAFGFFGAFGGYVGTSTTNESTAQDIFTAVIPSTYAPAGSPTNNESNMVGTINTQFGAIDSSSNNYVRSGRYVLLCFTYNNKKGSMTIGGTNGQQFTTDVQLGQRVSAKC